MLFLALLQIAIDQFLRQEEPKSDVQILRVDGQS